MQSPVEFAVKDVWCEMLPILFPDIFRDTFRDCKVSVSREFSLCGSSSLISFEVFPAAHSLPAQGALVETPITSCSEEAGSEVAGRFFGRI